MALIGRIKLTLITQFISVETGLRYLAILSSLPGFLLPVPTRAVIVKNINIAKKLNMPIAKNRSFPVSQ